MSPLKWLLCLLLTHLPWYATPLEGELLVRLGLNEGVWWVAVRQGLVKPWRDGVPGWWLASTDPRACEDPNYWRTTRPNRVYTLPERSGMTLNAIRQRAGAIR